MIDRRAVVTGTVSLFAAAWAVDAQQATRIPRIGMLGFGSPTPDIVASNESFLQALRELGYVEGRNVTVEWRWAGGKPEQLARLAAELVRLPVDVILVGTTSSAQAARQATPTIPIVMTMVPDPVAAGLVQSLGHPGGNITGMSLMTPELSAKQLELLGEVVPGLSRVGILRNPAGTGHRVTVRAAEAAARALRLDLRIVDARGPGDFKTAFAVLRRERAGAALVLAHPTFFAHRRRLVEAAHESRVPVLYGTTEHVQAGGLMSYAASVVESYRRGAFFVDRILKGARPGDLPVEQPTKFELVINLRTAKALGLTIPPAVLARADQVIE